MYRKISVLLCGLLSIYFLSGCGPKAFTKGEYDDVERENLLDDKWSETDMQKAVKELVGSLSNSNVIANARKKPIIMVTRLKNNTSEEIETGSIMDMIKVELTNSGRANFIDKEARQDISEEYEYQNSGMVNETSKKGPGGQIGADFVLNGRLESIVKQVGKDKTVYYKLTLNLTNLTTTLTEWTGQKEMRKMFRKKSVGL